MAQNKEPTHGYTVEGVAVHGKIIDHMPTDHLYGRINKKLAIWITAGVGSMTCAWLFAALAVAGLPTALQPGNIGFLFWFSSDLLQLTLLSVIIVGQNIQGQAADARVAKILEDVNLMKEHLDISKNNERI